MKRFVIYSLLVFSWIILMTPDSYGQAQFVEHKNDDNMRVLYRWTRSSPFNKESDAVLNLRVTNQNKTHVKWTYAIGLYDKGVLFFQSDKTELCMKPGESRRGSIAGLRFSAEGVTMEDVEHPDFAWEFIVFDVEEVQACE